MNETLEQDLNAALNSEKDSAEVMYFCMTYPDPKETAWLITMEWVKKNWNTLRNHIPIDGITIKNIECTDIEFVLPVWMGGDYVNIHFYEPSETDIVIDCIDMHMRYIRYKELFNSIPH